MAYICTGSSSVFLFLKKRSRTIHRSCFCRSILGGTWCPVNRCRALLQAILSRNFQLNGYPAVTCSSRGDWVVNTFEGVLMTSVFGKRFFVSMHPNTCGTYSWVFFEMSGLMNDRSSLFVLENDCFHITKFSFRC